MRQVSLNKSGKRSATTNCTLTSTQLQSLLLTRTSQHRKRSITHVWGFSTTENETELPIDDPGRDAQCQSIRPSDNFIGYGSNDQHEELEAQNVVRIRWMGHHQSYARGVHQTKATEIQEDKRFILKRQRFQTRRFSSKAARPGDAGKC